MTDKRKKEKERKLFFKLTHVKSKVNTNDRWFLLVDRYCYCFFLLWRARKLVPFGLLARDCYKRPLFPSSVSVSDFVCLYAAWLK